MSRITERGGFLDDDGVEHGFLPEEPPASPPHEFHVAGKVYDVDPEQCAAWYRAQGKTLPDKVRLALPDGGHEEHDWVGYGRRFKEIVAAVARGETVGQASQG